MKLRLAVVAVALVIAGCGGELRNPPAATPPADPNPPHIIDASAPAGTVRGRTVASEAGCLACHRISGEGNNGPGPDLTHVGSRLDRDQIEQVLRSPPSPMPSYRSLAQDDFRALVDYLAALH